MGNDSWLQHRQQANDDGEDPDEATPRRGATLTYEIKYPAEDFHNPSQSAECQHNEDDDQNNTNYFHNILFYRMMIVIAF